MAADFLLGENAVLVAAGAEFERAVEKGAVVQRKTKDEVLVVFGSGAVGVQECGLVPGL